MNVPTTPSTSAARRQTVSTRQADIAAPVTPDTNWKMTCALAHVSQIVNECTDNTLNKCSEKTNCVNTAGGHSCSCNTGYRLENDMRTCSRKSTS